MKWFESCIPCDARGSVHPTVRCYSAVCAMQNCTRGTLRQAGDAAIFWPKCEQNFTALAGRDYTGSDAVSFDVRWVSGATM